MEPHVGTDLDNAISRLQHPLKHFGDPGFPVTLGDEMRADAGLQRIDIDVAARSQSNQRRSLSEVIIDRAPRPHQVLHPRYHPCHAFRHRRQPSLCRP